MDRKLNLGCGNDYREGYVNVDTGFCRKDLHVDIAEPLPFEDNEFSEIVANHVLEHIPREKFFQVFRELHRVLKPGGILEFAVPMAGSDNYFTDPTHQCPFTDRTMDFVIKGKQLRENGIIYGADYEFIEVRPPMVDQVYTLYFALTKE